MRMTKERLKQLRAFVDDKPASYDWGRMEEALDEVEACWQDTHKLKLSLRSFGEQLTKREKERHAVREALVRFNEMTPGHPWSDKECVALADIIHMVIPDRADYEAFVEKVREGK